MAITTGDLAQELKQLRKGAGLQSPQLRHTVGPVLRAECGIGADDDDAMIRQKAQIRLGALADKLPADLRLTVKVALALDPDTPGIFFRDRVNLVADQLGRDYRTVVRRIDHGFELLAQIAAAPAGPPRPESPGSWHVRHFNALLRMDLPSPECFEQRTIAADHDGLDKVSVSITVPHPEHSKNANHDLLVEAYYGVRLTQIERPTTSRFIFHLLLPHALAAGEFYEYGLIMRLPPGQPMRPHYVFYPERPCDDFDLTVRFNPDSQPDRIWRVNEAFHRDIDDGQPTQEILEPNRVGEVHTSFQDLIPGRGYGLQWQAI